MAKDAIVFAMANPTPEIMPDLAKQAGVRVIGTGRSDFPNQVNNVLAFPGIFKGALSVRARDINPAMKMAAAKAIAGLIPDDELNEENILPKAFDPRVPMPSPLRRTGRERKRRGARMSIREIPAAAITDAVEALCIEANTRLPAT